MADDDSRQAMPSPSTSLLSATESNSQQSSYDMPHSLVMPPTNFHPMPYNGPADHMPPFTPTRTGMPGHEHWTPMNGMYAPPFPTPAGNDHYSPYGPPDGYPLTSSVLRHDVTPQAGNNYHAMQHTGRASQKRKRASGSGGGKIGSTRILRTPQRPLLQMEEERTVKRPRQDDVSVTSTAPSQLPTPPSLGRDISTVSLPTHVQPPPPNPSPPPTSESDGEPARRQSVTIARHRELGRRINLSNDQEGIQETETSTLLTLPPRKKTIPSLAIDATGHAQVATDEVLESELAWLSGPSTSTIGGSSQLRTPAMTSRASLPEEVDDTPRTKEYKVVRRLQRFSTDVKLDEPMVSTRISNVGRVALRKDAAIRFIGLLDGPEIYEETRQEEEDRWIESSKSNRTRVIIRPDWPDHEAPWALAGGRGMTRLRREALEKAELIRRYLESMSDEDSDEDREDMIPLEPNSKAEAVSTYISRAQALINQRRRKRPVIEADARSALLVSLRQRTMEYEPGGPIDCRCGDPSTSEKGKIISCDGCGSWHHLSCQGITDELSLRGYWSCPRCVHHILALQRTIMATDSGSSSSTYRERGPLAFHTRSANVALAPSPMFAMAPTTTFRTPVAREISSPRRPHRSRVLSYEHADYFTFPEDTPGNGPPSTPAPIRPNRHSTPRHDDAFDVTSTPSRHIDFNLGGPSLFSLTPLGGKGRVASGAVETPIRRSLAHGIMGSEPSEFFRELNRGSGIEGVGIGSGIGMSPQSRWPHTLMGTHTLTPSPFGHKRSLSGNAGRLSSIRSSSRSGLGMAFEEHDD
ncbi:hypothetical protein M231_03999 [Tremella mesenterica]|uniref:PHD-type domain-containing protein n=1 Tax=Tremella mesenterica TaxID=5217 RepID=A0A4Q1BLL2_TREME|nr:hypothetical protein M231_03999 [Tremella mesenterica]